VTLFLRWRCRSYRTRSCWTAPSRTLLQWRENVTRRCVAGRRCGAWRAERVAPGAAWAAARVRAQGTLRGSDLGPCV
jgi:hypothetical protein